MRLGVSHAVADAIQDDKDCVGLVFTLSTFVLSIFVLSITGRVRSS